MLPDPDCLRRFLDESRAPDTEKPLYEYDTEELAKRGFKTAYAIYFSPTDKHKFNFPGWPNPGPSGHRGDHWDPRYLGKCVGGRFVWQQEVLDRIKLETEVLAKRGIVELWDGVWLSELRIGNALARREFVFPIADGNGGARTRAERDARPEARGRFENLVHSPQYQPTVGRQNLLIAPFPFAGKVRIEERIVLDEFFAREPVPVVLLCKAETWQPGKPDYSIEIGLDGLNIARDDIRMVCVFTSIQSGDLLELFARLSGKNPAEIHPDGANLDELARLRARALGMKAAGKE